MRSRGVLTILLYLKKTEPLNVILLYWFYVVPFLCLCVFRTNFFYSHCYRLFAATWRHCELFITQYLKCGDVASNWNIQIYSLSFSLNKTGVHIPFSMELKIEWMMKRRRKNKKEHKKVYEKQFKQKLNGFTCVPSNLLSQLYCIGGVMDLLLNRLSLLILFFSSSIFRNSFSLFSGYKSYDEGWIVLEIIELWIVVVYVKTSI